MLKKTLDRIKKDSEKIKNHLDLLLWLELDVQSLIEHQIAIMAWGDFEHGRIQFDVLSRIEGVRTSNIAVENMHKQVIELFNQWHQRDEGPFSLETATGIFEDCFLNPIAKNNPVGRIRNILVHGVQDHRSKEECLYIFLREGPPKNNNQIDLIKNIIFFLDTAARRIHYPTKNIGAMNIGKDRRKLTSSLLSDRENEVMQWVIKGKSNDDIALILNISAYTVKNHIYRIYKKLGVSNRAQATSLLCR